MTDNMCQFGESYQWFQKHLGSSSSVDAKRLAKAGANVSSKSFHALSYVRVRDSAECT